jgi:hypothetical protein
MPRRGARASAIARNFMIALVAGGGFEPPTFGLWAAENDLPSLLLIDLPAPCSTVFHPVPGCSVPNLFLDLFPKSHRWHSWPHHQGGRCLFSGSQI